MDSLISLQRGLVALICFLAALAVVTILNFVPIPLIQRVFIGRTPDQGFTIFAIQTVIWVVFFIGVGELWIRSQWAKEEWNELSQKYLPEDSSSMLTRQDLSGVIQKVNQRSSEHLFLPQLIRRVSFQFQTTESVAQANEILNSSLDMFLHEIDLRYNSSRYIVWLVPTLGFIGTVMGISSSLGAVVTSGEDISIPVSLLSVAFDTTFLALIFAGILMFFLHLIQGREERTLNRAGQYCLDNLVNRLFGTK